MASSIEQQAKGNKQGEVRYLTPLDIETKKEAKYCRFKKNGIKYIDYKDADFLMYLVRDREHLELMEPFLGFFLLKS